MSQSTPLGFDSIERAGELWQEHFGDPAAMKVVTSIMRVQQLLISQLDTQLKPFNITFARYEVLVLLTFSQRGTLPLSKIGNRLMVHPTSVTNAINRLEAQRLVSRRTDKNDRRVVLAKLTPLGKRVTMRATAALTSATFGLKDLPGPDLDQLYTLLQNVRFATGDLPGAEPADERSRH